MSKKNTLVGLLGGTLPLEMTVDLIRYTPEMTVESVRFDLMEVLNMESGFETEEHLALIVDSPGGTVMQYMSWLMIMNDPNIKTKTAYVANHAESAAAMIVASADKIICLPTSRFYFHYTSGVNQEDHGSVTDPHKIVMGYHFTIDSLIQFANKHLNDSGKEWLEEAMLNAFYTSRDAGIEDLKKIASGAKDWQTTTDSSIYRNDGSLEFSGAELAKKGAVELVDSVKALEDRYEADRVAIADDNGSDTAKIAELFQWSGFVEMLRADSDQEYYVTLFGDGYAFEGIPKEQR